MYLENIVIFCKFKYIYWYKNILYNRFLVLRICLFKIVLDVCGFSLKFI